MSLKTLKKAIIAYVDFIKAVWSDIAYPLIITGGRNTNLEDYRIYGNSVQEGTPTPETPVEVQSVGELVTEGEYAGKYKIPVLIRAKNIYNKQAYPLNVLGWVNASNYGVINGNSGDKMYVSTGYVPCETLHNQILTFSPTAGNNVGVCFYDVNKKFIKGFPYRDKTSYTLTVPEGSAYMRFSTLSGSEEVFQIEIGDISTEYEPYVKPETVDIYLDEPLRKVGDYSDYIDFDKGVVKRHITRTDFKDLAWSEGSNLMFYTTVYTGLSGAGVFVSCISNILPYKNISTSGGQQGVCIASGNIIRVRWESLFPTLSDWKTFINNNNESYILFPRKDSRSEELEIPSLPQFKGTTIYEVQTKVNPSGIEACYYG